MFVSQHDLGFVPSVSADERALLRLSLRQLAYAAAKLAPKPPPAKVAGGGEKAAAMAPPPPPPPPPLPPGAVGPLTAAELRDLLDRALGVDAALAALPATDGDGGGDDAAPPPLVLDEFTSRAVAPTSSRSSGLGLRSLS